MGLLVGFAAGGLESAELGGVLFDGAVDALLVEGDEGEETGLLDPGLAFGQGVVDFVVAGFGFAGVAVDAFGEDVVLDGAGALEAPAVFGYRLDEVGFLNADGGEFGVIGLAVSAEGFGLFGSVDVDFAGESVFEGVEAGAALAGGGAGAGGRVKL